MARIKTEVLKPGMILAQDLRHSSGRFLLAKGVRLEPNHLRILKIWGIETVDVLDPLSQELPDAETKIDPAFLEEAERRLEKKFVLAQGKHPFFEELFSVCKQRLALKISEKPERNRGSERGDVEFPTADIAYPVLEEEETEDPERLVGDDLRLASLPNVFFEIIRVISDPRSSAIQIADVISKDPSLSAKLLKIVNSAFYNFPSKIDTVTRAVLIVGSKQLSALALGTSVLTLFRDIPSDLVDMRSFWEHSVACGLASRILASYKNVSNTERLFVAGLLHDIGRLVLCKNLPHALRKVLLKQRQVDQLLVTMEPEVLGFDHAQLGGILLRQWKFPLILEQAVRYHHDPLRAQYPLDASVVHLADILCNALSIGTSGEHLVPPLDEAAWKELDLPVEILSKISSLLDRQVEEVLLKFFDDDARL